MKRNFFLTSVLVLAGLMRPTLAETFPTDGYMLEDKTYENAATYTNTGVYEGEVNATAEYTDNIYKIAAGMYLPKESEVAAPCTAGYFCTGMTDAMYSESSDQGLNKCPTEYPNSVAGAGAQTQCYTACTLATANIAHATAVDGNDYYGDGTDTCVATECELGYHTNGGLKIVNKTPVIPVDYTVGGDGGAAVKPDGTVSHENFPDAELTTPNTWATHFSYGTIYGRASCQPGLPTGFEFFINNMELVLTGEMTLEDFENSFSAIVGTSKAAYATNLLRELINAEASGNEETIIAMDKSLYEFIYVVLGSKTDTNYSTTDTGETCYCQITGYTLTGGNFESVTNTPWVFNDYGTSIGCTDMCAIVCSSYAQAEDFTGYLFRPALFGARELAETGGTCAANDITINWTDAEEIGDAGMCKYGGDIKTPVKAVTKKGKTFKGWRFEKTN